MVGTLTAFSTGLSRSKTVAAVSTVPAESGKIEPRQMPRRSRRNVFRVALIVFETT